MQFSIRKRLFLFLLNNVFFPEHVFLIIQEQQKLYYLIEGKVKRYIRKMNEYYNILYAIPVHQVGKSRCHLDMPILNIVI